MPRRMCFLRTPYCSAPSASIITVTRESVAWPHAGQKSLLVFFVTVWHASHRKTKRSSWRMRRPLRLDSRRPIWSATFCSPV